MKIDGKIVMKLLFVCLVMLTAGKADDLLHCDARTSAAEIISEIRNTETNLIRTENSAFSIPETQCRIPRQTNFTGTARTLVQAGRHNISSQGRNGFTMTKSGKSMNEYSTSLFFISILNFPSGLNESSHHLIRLRKLII